MCRQVVCTDVCTYIHTCKIVWLEVDKYELAWMCRCVLCVCVYIYIYKKCVYIGECKCMYVCVCVCVYFSREKLPRINDYTVRVHTHVHRDTHVHHDTHAHHDTLYLSITITLSSTSARIFSSITYKVRHMQCIVCSIRGSYLPLILCRINTSLSLLLVLLLLYKYQLLIRLVLTGILLIGHILYAFLFIYELYTRVYVIYNYARSVPRFMLLITCNPTLYYFLHH